MDKCPCCGRPFKSIGEFPRIRIMEVRILDTSEIPEKIPSWKIEEIPISEVPPEVVDFFLENPDEKEVCYSDYIYYPPKIVNLNKLEEDIKNLVGKDKEINITIRGIGWRRCYNWHSFIKKLLREFSMKDYLERVKRKEGKEISPEELLPNWKRNEIFDVYCAPLEERPRNIYLGFKEKEQYEKGRTSEIVIYEDGPSFGLNHSIIPLLSVGKIIYKPALSLNQL